ncbi:MAG: bacteriohemerythrin [bacterium]
MRIILWKPLYSINIEEIDEQHKGLIEIINLTTYAKTKNHPEKLKEILTKLIEYTHVHLKYEEEHMLNNGYGKLAEHHKQHQVLIKQVITVLEQLKQGDKEVLESIFNILENWLINHILKDDREYGLYCDRKNKMAAK